MHWILAGFLMFAASVVTYLLVRAAALRNMPPALQNLSMFLVPLVIYIPMIVATGTSWIVTPYQMVLLAVTAILFSYFGSRLSVDSIRYAPNPGYSLIISKSYVVFTTLVAVAIFGSPLTLQSALAILLIIGFSALIMIDPGAIKRTGVDPKWLPLALGAFLCWGMLAVMSKYLLDLGVPIFIRLVYVMGIACALFAWDARRAVGQMRSFRAADWALFAGIGLFAGMFNYFMQVGYQISPNIGFINALNAASIAAVTVGAVFLFKDEFNLRKFAGVAGAIAGLILLVI